VKSYESVSGINSATQSYSTLLLEARENSFADKPMNRGSGELTNETGSATRGDTAFLSIGF
jgi:hypothetical protein